MRGYKYRFTHRDTASFVILIIYITLIIDLHYRYDGRINGHLSGINGFCDDFGNRY